MANIELAAVNDAIMDETVTDADGCFSLGMIYSAGAGVAVDLVQAHKWFNIAAAKGLADAARMRGEVAAEMSSAEIAEAQRAARAFLSLH